jgi:hypothetical protein
MIAHTLNKKAASGSHSLKNSKSQKNSIPYRN